MGLLEVKLAVVQTDHKMMSEIEHLYLARILAELGLVVTLLLVAAESLAVALVVVVVAEHLLPTGDRCFLANF